MERLDIPELPASIKEMKAKSYREWWPGKIGFAPIGSAASGCRSMVFDEGDLALSSTALNSFFAENEGIVAVQLNVSGQQIFLLYTKTVSPEEMERFNRVERKVHELIEKEDLDNEQAQAAQEAAMASLSKQVKVKEEAERKENNRLIEMGRVHEKNCAKKKGK